MEPVKIKLGNIEIDKSREIQAWCREHLGTIGFWKDHLGKNSRWTFTRDSKNQEVTYFFFDEKDATLFCLKWAGTPIK